MILAIAVVYPYYTTTAGSTDTGKMFQIPIFGAFPNMDDDGRHGGVRDDGDRPQHGRRLRRLLDLGYVAFYAIGAYAAGLVRLAALRWATMDIRFGGVGDRRRRDRLFTSRSGLLLLARGPVPRPSPGWIIGLPTLRLRGDYLAIVTLGFGEILPQIAANGDKLFGTGFNLTNGAQGINPIDPAGLRWFA